MENSRNRVNKFWYQGRCRAYQSHSAFHVDFEFKVVIGFITQRHYQFVFVLPLSGKVRRIYLTF